MRFIVLHSMSNHLFLGKLLGREGFAEICEVLTSLSNSVINVVTFLTLVSVHNYIYGKQKSRETKWAQRARVLT